MILRARTALLNERKIANALTEPDWNREVGLSATTIAMDAKGRKELWRFTQRNSCKGLNSSASKSKFQIS